MRIALAAVLLGCALPTAGHAAVTDQVSMSVPTPSIKAGERMLVESDQLVYDYDNNAVSAVGNVKIYYGGYTLEAEKVTYNKTSGRLYAYGHVKLVDPTGSAFYSDYLDITDDFGQGFVESLRVDSAQHTHFGAQSAEHTTDETTFNNGSYTACEPCKAQPEKPPLWNVRAQKIVVDHKEHMVYFTNAKFEFMGLPVAWMPYFATPDPTVKRKSGFLSPNFGYAEKLGFFASVPYYWTIAPNMDVTFTPTYLTRQGFLGQLEFRHRLSNGQYSIQLAGISQKDPSAFDGTSGAQTFRGAVSTTGKFSLTQDWTFGWSGTLLSDRTFTRDYGVINEDVSGTTSTVYLTGVRDRNYFDIRTSTYQVLTASSADAYKQARQAMAVPEIDSKRYVDHPLFGGELSFTSNLTALTRGEDDLFHYPTDTTIYNRGTAGTFVRATEQVDWQRRFIGPMGQVITPFAYVRGDAFYLNGQTSTAIADGLTSDSRVYRFMPAVGVDWSLPILAQAPHVTSIIEPRVQVIVRPNEMKAGVLPNNDAQSLVFDASNLFTHDKFSGFDREEGGTRMNVGLHYNASFDSGASLDATVGQSFQLAGVNPYATQDIAGIGGSVMGLSSGLETNASDYVAGGTIDTGLGPRISANGRFDNSTFALNRGEVEATAALGPVSASAAYLYVRHNPYDKYLGSASVVRGAGSINISDNWRAFGSVIYNLNANSIDGNGLGLAFDNDCLTFSIAYNEMSSRISDLPTRSLTFRLQLRTLGDTSYKTNLDSASTN